MANQVVGYGNWRKPRGAGVMGMSTLGFVIATLGAIFGVIVTSKSGVPGLLTVAAVTILLIVLTSARTTYGYRYYEVVDIRLMWMVSRLLGSNWFMGGLLRRKGSASAHLPGVLGPSRLIEATDVAGRRFVVVEHVRSGLYTLVFQAYPDGLALVDQPTIDSWVANWGQFLADTGHEPGLVGASVVVETAPDTGTGLRLAIEPQIDPNAPQIAQDMLRDVVERYPLGSAQVNAYVTLTYSGQVHARGRKRKRDEMTRELATRIPVILDSLAATGAGNVCVMDGPSLCKAIRCAFDIEATARYTEAAKAGVSVNVGWDNVGPISAKAQWDCYIHDGAKSVTWELVEAPKGIVRSDVLASLLAPHADLERKRLTMLYVPFESGRAARTVERDQRNASVAASATSRTTARQVKDVADTLQAAKEEAAGAGVEDFSMLLTVTGRYTDDFRETSGLVDSLAASSRCRLRRCYGQQDSAFAAGLPVGIVPQKFDLVPAALKELM